MLKRAKLVPQPLQECVACGWGWAQEGRAEGPQSFAGCCGKAKRRGRPGCDGGRPGLISWPVSSP